MSAVTLGISMTAFGAVLGVLLVPIFNGLPASWLTEVGESPSESVRAKPRLEPMSWALPLMFAVILLSKMVAKVVTVPWATPFAAIAIAALILVAIADWKYRIVPDQLLAVIALCGAVLLAARIGTAANPWLIVGNTVVGAVVVALILLTVRWLVSRLTGSAEPLGMGDVKLAFAAALLLAAGEWMVFLALIAVMGAAGVLALRATGRLAGDGTVAYAPFIVGAAIITLIFGDRLLSLFGA